MPKPLKRFLYNSFLAALVLGLAAYLYDLIGPSLAGDYFNLVWWGLNIGILAITVFIGWRLYVGIESGRLLFDDIDE